MNLKSIQNNYIIDEVTVDSLRLLVTDGEIKHIRLRCSQTPVEY